MRSILALSLLLAFSATANAATVHHSYRHYGNYYGDYRASRAEMYAPVRGPVYVPDYYVAPVLPAPPGPGPDGNSYGNPYQNWGG